MTSDIRRIYSVSDDEMLASGDAMLVELKKHQSSFSAFNPRRYTQAYIDAFEAALDAAHDIGIDMMELQKQAAETEAFNATVEECAKAFRHLAQFVVDAFPDSKSQQNQFGLSEFAAMQRRPAHFVLFMESIVRSVTTYRAELSAAGCSDELIDRIVALTDQLRENKTSQKEHMRARPVHTDQRKNLMNAVWEFMVKISENAKVVFAAQPELRKLFKLPKRNDNGTSDDDTDTAGTRGAGTKAGA